MNRKNCDLFGKSFPVEFIDSFNHSLHLIVCHYGTDGEAEDLGVDLFGDGKGEMVPLFVRFLLVWRDGVVDECLYALFGQIGLKLVASFTPHGEEVEDVA